MDLVGIFGGMDTDRLKELIDLVGDHKESLALLAKLPDFLDKIADGLAGAGEQARAAAVALVGDDGTSGVRVTLADSAVALSSIVAAVGAGAERIADAATSAAKVPLMDGPASRLADAADRMGTTTGELGDLATGMESIGETLAAVGAAIAKLGDHLGESGAQAKSFVGLT